MIDSIKWEISHHCNLKCKHCFFGKVEYEPDLNLELNKKIVDILIEKNIKNIMFSSKEPFAYKNFIELIKYCRLKGMSISIITNGTLINDKHIKELVKCKVKVISMSLEGITQDSNDFVRGKGVYQKVLENANKLSEVTKNNKNVLPLALQMSLTTENINEAKNFNDFFKKSPFITVNLGDISLVGNALDNRRLKLTNEEYESMIMTFLKEYSADKDPQYVIHLKKSSAYDTIYYNMLFDLSMDIIIPSCSAYFGYYSILPNGDTCACVALKGLENAEALNIYSKANILDTKKFIKESRIPSLNSYKEEGFCQICRYRNKCTLCLLITTDQETLKDVIHKCETGYIRLKKIMEEILNGSLPFKFNRNSSIFIKDGSTYIKRLYDGGEKITLDVSEVDREVIQIYEQDKYVYMDNYFKENQAYWIKKFIFNDVLSINYDNLKKER